jgi:hypothetical protein
MIDQVECDSHPEVQRTKRYLRASSYTLAMEFVLDCINES